MTGFAAFLAGCLLILVPAGGGARADGAAFSLSPREHASAKLRAAGVSEELIAQVEKLHVPEERDRIVELNVLGFLGKADYSKHYSRKAVERCRKFIQRYGRPLRQAEARFRVPREVIAALLWVETKHGARTGTFNVPHVYFSLLQSDHPEVMRATLAALGTRAPASAEDHKQKVIDRSHAKADWALGELRSLDEVRRSGAKDLKSLTGSYAGAFGIPQFIPSSYVRWARPRREARRPDLFDMEDAIHSVGHYLSANGWRRGDAEAERKALYHYNRADGYVEVILRIAREAGRRH